MDFTSLLEGSLKKYWDCDALTDYHGATLQYKDLARKIAKLHLLFEEGGIVQGDKIAICGRNSSQWAVAFLATLTYGAVAVPLLHEFKPDRLQQLINHCDARLLFVGNFLREQLNYDDMPALEGVLELEDFDPVIMRNERLEHARLHLNEYYGRKYPSKFTINDVHYRSVAPTQLALINYTSGTTSHPKGVMLPYRSLYSNMRFAMGALKLEQGSRVVSMLPMAHTYGMSFEFLYEICAGVQIYFLTRTPSPRIIFEAFAEVKPDIIVTVPLIIEKIINTRILPRLETPLVKLLLRLPVVSDKIKDAIYDQMMASFGGRLRMLVIGGAAFNHKVEDLLHRIGFPYTVGYGMTECGPIICYEDPATFQQGSCGRATPRMEVRIDNPGIASGIGEIMCRGDNVMLGYYKNEEASNAVLTADGWLHTGDLGILDADGNLYVRGRIKNMILSSNGQNIYPEELEEELGNFPLVSESLVVKRGNALVALVVPDYELAYQQSIPRDTVPQHIEEYRLQLNAQLASYEQIAAIELHEEEFEKTPKRSIRRYLYS